MRSAAAGEPLLKSRIEKMPIVDAIQAGSGERERQRDGVDSRLGFDQGAGRGDRYRLATTAST